MKSLLFCSALLTSMAPRLAMAGEGIDVLVLREHGVGSAAQAQQYLDQLVAAAAKVNGWSAASGKFMTSREQAVSWIEASRPEFGILSLPGYLALRTKHGLAVVGKAELTAAGGRSYYIVSAKHEALSDCKGKTLATDHADDPRFIDKVVAGKNFALADFRLVATKRPLQTIKAAIRGEAECALIDDAQFADLSNVEGGPALKKVWKSADLPPMVVVAFQGTDAATKTKFAGKLADVCKGDGKQACTDAGIRSLSATSEATYKAVIKAYGD